MHHSTVADLMLGPTNNPAVVPKPPDHGQIRQCRATKVDARKASRWTRHVHILRAACGRAHLRGDCCESCLYGWRYHDERIQGPSRPGNGSLICCLVGPASNAVMPDPTLVSGQLQVQGMRLYLRAQAVGDAMMMRFAAAGQQENQGTLLSCVVSMAHRTGCSARLPRVLRNGPGSTKSCCQHDVRTQARSSRNGGPGLGGLTYESADAFRVRPVGMRDRGSNLQFSRWAMVDFSCFVLLCKW